MLRGNRTVVFLGLVLGGIVGGLVAALLLRRRQAEGSSSPLTGRQLVKLLGPVLALVRQLSELVTS